MLQVKQPSLTRGHVWESETSFKLAVVSLEALLRYTT